MSARRVAATRRAPRLLRLLARLEGPQTLGRGPWFWGGFALVVAAAMAYPLLEDGYTVGNTIYFSTGCSWRSASA